MTTTRAFCIGGYLDSEHHKIACPVHRKVARPFGGVTMAEATVSIRMALEGCTHDQAEPVVLSTGEVVACVCVACIEALPADWIANQYRRAEREAWCTHENWVADIRFGQVGETKALHRLRPSVGAPVTTLTTDQAATHLGIDPVTVRRWVMKGWLTPIRRGVHPLQFRYVDVETARVARKPASWHDRLDELATRWERACLESHAE